MMKQLQIPRINNILLFIILLSIILYFGKEVLIVIAFSGLFAMLMTPLAERMEKHSISRGLSSTISLLIIIAFVFAFVFLLTQEVTLISNSLPKFQSKMETYINNTQKWITDSFGVSYDKQMSTLKDQAKNAFSSAGNFLRGFATGIVRFTGSFFLTLLFMFLFLYNREKYKNFIILFYSEDKRHEVSKIVDQTAQIAQHFLVGRIISIFVLMLFYVIGLLIVGVKNIFMLAIIGSVFSIVPYVGPIVGAVLVFLMVLVTQDQVGSLLGVIIVIVVSQFIQNHFVEPFVVGGKLNISPLFSFVILILGGMIWGIAGIILFLPLLGIAKILFDHIEGMQPYAYLIGSSGESSTDKIWEKVKGLFKRKKEGYTSSHHRKTARS